MFSFSTWNTTTKTEKKQFRVEEFPVHAVKLLQEEHSKCYKQFLFHPIQIQWTLLVEVVARRMLQVLFTDCHFFVCAICSAQVVTHKTRRKSFAKVDKKILVEASGGKVYNVYNK